jgi:DNA-binding CsgD family transcriptional regulator
MRPCGIRDVMKVFLPRHDGLGSVFVFDTSGSGFGGTDRALVGRLVPALVQFQRNAHLRAQLFAADHRLRSLTPRELTVLARAAAGETNAEIARALFVNPSAVRKHLEHVYEKLAVRNRAAAAGVYAQASGQPGRRRPLANAKLGERRSPCGSRSTPSGSRSASLARWLRRR